MEEYPLVAPGIRRLTVNLDNDDVTLFEGVWAVPNGVALHCYLLRGEKTVLIDPWDDGGYGPEEVGADLAGLGLKWGDVTAVAFTRPPAADLESRLKAQYPGLEVWGLPASGARHDLGGISLEEQGGFWAASPSGVLFSGDAFAGLGWVDEELWTEDLGEHEARYFADEALRWFARRPLVPELPQGVRVVAPAHGCLWKNPEKALQQAQRFDSWATEGLEEVTVVWSDDDEAGIDALVGGVLDIGAALNLYRVPGDDAATLAAGARRASLIVLAEGLDDGFLQGLQKDVWRPKTGEAPAELRSGVVRQWEG